MNISLVVPGGSPLEFYGYAADSPDWVGDSTAREITTPPPPPGGDTTKDVATIINKHPVSQYILKVPVGERGVRAPQHNMCALAGFPPEIRSDHDTITRSYNDFEKALKNTSAESMENRAPALENQRINHNGRKLMYIQEKRKNKNRKGNGGKHKGLLGHLKACWGIMRGDRR